MIYLDRKKWLDIAKKALLLSKGNDVPIQLLKDSVLIRTSYFELRLPYPHNKPLHVLPFQVKAVQLQAVLSVFIEDKIELNWKEPFLQFIENSIVISIPIFNLENEDFPEPQKKIAGQTVRDFKTPLDILKTVRGGIKSSGIGEYIYWEKDKLLAYTGNALLMADFFPAPLQPIPLPPNVVNFLSSDFMIYNQVVSVEVHEPQIVEIGFGDLGTLRFTLPSAPKVDWSELIPTLPVEKWMGIPSAFLRLGQISNTLNTRHHSQAAIHWSQHQLTVKNESSHSGSIDFFIEDTMPYKNERSGVVDVTALNPIIQASDEMNWATNNMMIFRSHIFTFFYMPLVK